MAFNAFRQSVFSMDAPCLPCCDVPCILTIGPYANETEAQDVLDSALISNCVGACSNSSLDDLACFPTFSYSVTGSGSISVNYSMTGSLGPPTSCPARGIVSRSAITAEIGAILTMTYSAGGTAGTGQSGQLEIYDEDNVLVELVSGTGGTNLVSSALPYSGCYFVELTAGPEVITDLTGTVTATIGLTSDLTMTLEGIRASYDDGGGGTSYLICV